MKTIRVGFDGGPAKPFNVLGCPHCNGDPELVLPRRGESFYAITCESCGARGPRSSRPVKAIEWWNHRGEPDEFGTVWG